MDINYVHKLGTHFKPELIPTKKKCFLYIHIIVGHQNKRSSKFETILVTWTKNRTLHIISI